VQVDGGLTSERGFLGDLLLSFLSGHTDLYNNNGEDMTNTRGERPEGGGGCVLKPTTTTTTMTIILIELPVLIIVLII